MSVYVKADLRGFKREVDAVVRKQIPFAAAVALTRSARDGVEAVRVSLPRQFEIRNKGLLKRWLSTRADKKDWPRLRAQIGSKDEWWRLQEEGGAKKPTRGKTVVIPTRLVRTSPGARIRKSQYPSQLFAQGKARATPDTFRAVRQRRRRKDPREILYLRRPRVRIRPALEGQKTIGVALRKVYGEHFRRELEQALRSRRVREGSFSSEQGRAAYLAAGQRMSR